MEISFYAIHERYQNQIIGTHKHNCYEVVYYQSASGEARNDDCNYEFITDNFAIIPPNVNHEEFHKINGSVIFIGFTGDFDFIKETTVLKDDESHTIKKLLKSICDECATQENDYLKMVSLKLEQFIIYLKRILLKDSDKNKKSRDLSLVISYIKENYNFSIEIEQLAKMTNYSEGHFRRLFNQEFGVSPLEYILEIRLVKAKELLEVSTSSCSEIASICGFSDAAQFSKLFKRRFGTSPKQYKTQYLS